MANLTLEQYRLIFPNCQNLGFWIQELNLAMTLYDIDTANQQAAFLANAAIESGDLNRLVENLNYSPEGLIRVWPYHFRMSGRIENPAVAEFNDEKYNALYYARKPECIANIVYANRLGNGDVGSNEGWKYRGRGIFQITGKENYTKLGHALNLGLVDQPELLENYHVAAISAGWYWHSRSLNLVLEHFGIDLVCVRINGGSTLIKERKERYNNILKILK